jgi:phenylpyruvate tautomerase
MPYVSVQTSVELPEAKRISLLGELTKTLVTHLRKPEEYVMAAIEPRQRMFFGGSGTPTAFVTVKSIGLPDSLTPLTAALCKLLADEAGVAADRVYVTFEDIKAAHWGHNGATFG